MLSNSTTSEIHAIFAALGDPIRRMVIEYIAAHGPQTATQLATQFPISRQGVLKHLIILNNAGLVVVQQVGKEKRYQLVPQAFGSIEQWVATLSIVWDERLSRLKQLIEE
ncbi:ArsR/SmtB family transcription factor [Herpetosiphon llansteffanensis]|uniref:ArsR/SmtB family transcription factor n=1 Tax=Herpetosiphon llansteffanensis TaxID=2094568 RepID=UPI000D7C6E33|nr:helix-turn-helix transcriptional regulator [Herpetosiphon llansteffanensis]